MNRPAPPELAASLEAFSDVLAPVVKAATRAGIRVALVGGAVRDLALGRQPPELDLVLLGGADILPGIVEDLRGRSGWTVTKTHERFGTASLVDPMRGLRLDLALARTEVYPSPGFLPVVSLGATLEADLARRDFSINALAVCLPEVHLVDPFGGWEDLQKGSLRLLHRVSLADDPTRALRAARYAARLDFIPESVIFSEAMAESLRTGAWKAISGDRLRVSLAGVLAEARWPAGFLRVLLPWRVLDSIVSRAVRVELPAVHSPGATDWTRLLSLLDPESARCLVERLSLPRKTLKRAGVK